MYKITKNLLAKKIFLYFYSNKVKTTTMKV